MSTRDQLIGLHAERTSELARRFLASLRALRVDSRALQEAGMLHSLFKRLLQRDPAFAAQYESIHKELAENPWCRKCNREWHRTTQRARRGLAFEVCDNCRREHMLTYFDTRTTRFARLIRSMRSRGICELKVDDLERMFESQAGLCFFSGKEMVFNAGPDCVSPDRVDPRRPYSRDNVVLCRRRVNLMKRDMLAHEFTMWCSRVSSPKSHAWDGIIPSLTECHALINNARRRGRECTLDAREVQELYVKQRGLCAYSKTPMTPYRDNASREQISIDRIDPDKPYVTGNITLCCLAVNLMKLDMEVHEFVSECSAIASRA